MKVICISMIFLLMVFHVLAQKSETVMKVPTSAGSIIKAPSSINENRIFGVIGNYYSLPPANNVNEGVISKYASDPRYSFQVYDTAHINSFIHDQHHYFDSLILVTNESTTKTALEAVATTQTTLYKLLYDQLMLDVLKNLDDILESNNVKIYEEIESLRIEIDSLKKMVK